MLRRFMLMFLLMLLVIPSEAFAAAVVPSYTYYVSYLDQYRMDYEIINAASYELYYVSPDNQVYTAEYSFSPTGIHYLTCNGTYRLNFFDQSGALIASTKDTVTSSILSPSCSSYPNQANAKNDLNANYTPSNNGGYDLSWDPAIYGDHYEVWKDGSKVGETTGTNYHLNDGGSMSIVAKDSTGAIVGQSDLNIPRNCEVCKQLQQLLQCPDWDTYMGDLTQAFKDALPPPPDWQDIANKIGAATVQDLQDYFGPVPTAPAQADIDSQLSTPLPTVDISTPTVQPTMPTGFESAKPFDISSGPQIDTTDSSQPFQIFDPLSNLTFSSPGVPVVPGDPNNNTGGIQKPAIIAPYPTVTPKPLPSDLPNNPVPIPSSSPGSAPTPNPSSTPGSGPIPIYKG